jgi:LuxR family maltose regulon positive regulatory protein
MLPAQGEGGGAERRLIRPRLIRRMSSALASGIAQISGPHGSGKATLVRSWARQAGAALIWFEGRADEDAEQLARLAALLQGDDGATVAAVLRGPASTGGETHAALIELRRRHPGLRLLLVRGLGATLAASDSSVRPGGVINARTLAFTQSEVIQLGELVGARVDHATARSVLSHTGGYAMAVDTIVRQLPSTGRLSPELLEESTDLLTAAVGEGVRDEAISSGGWQRMLHTAIPDSLSVAQLGWIWDTDKPEVVLGMLEGAGMLRLLDGSSDEPQLALVPALRTGLRRRAQVEMSRARLHAVVVETAAWLERRGDLEGSARLLQENGLTHALVDWVGRHWLDLPSLPVGSAADLLRSLPNNGPADVRLLVARARLLTDIFQAGHDGQLRSIDLRRAEADVEAASAAPGQDEAEPVRAATAGVRAILARARGQHDRALEQHREAIASVPTAYLGVLGPSLHAQAGLTALSLGDFSHAVQELARAQEVLPDDAPPQVRALMRELERLAAGYLGALHPTDEGEPMPQELLGSMPGWVRALGDASRLIAQLDVTSAWDALGRLPIATGTEDPAALLVLRAQAEAMAHLLSGSVSAGLGSLDVIEALLHDRQLSPFEAAILRNTRAELLVAVGEPEEALVVLEGGGPPTGLVATLVRCLVLLALGRAKDAAVLMEPLLPSSSSWASTHPTWMLVMGALVFHEVGEREGAAALLSRGVAIASRSGALLPFARQGAVRMAQLIDRARELRLDPASERLLDRLDLVKERIRLTAVRARLSDRELVVLERLREAPATRRLAALLHVSPNTVKSQLQSIYRKLGVSTREEALRAAILLGLLEEDAVT